MHFLVGYMKWDSKKIPSAFIFKKIKYSAIFISFKAL